MAYASRTGSSRQLAEFRARGWRMLVSATGVLRTEGLPYAIDNGAWTAYNSRRPFDVEAFERVVALLGNGADWIVCPDVVGQMWPSLYAVEHWLPKLAAYHVLIPVQDGTLHEDVRPWLGPRVGLAIGGHPATNWKEQTAGYWAELARERGCYLHMLRVNTRRRFDVCHEVGVDSFDGTSGTKWADNIPKLDRWRAEPTLWSHARAR